MTFRPGRLLALAILALWALLFGAYLGKNGASKAETVTLSAPVEAGLTQRGVFYRGRRIGTIRDRLGAVGDGWEAEQKGELLLNLMGRERKLTIEGSARLGREGRLHSFRFRLATISGPSPFETEVTGRAESNDLTLTIRSAGTSRTERRSLSEPIVLPLNLYYSLASRGLEPGKTYRVRLFDPMTLSDGVVEVTVLDPEIVRWSGREGPGYRLRTQFAGITTTAWVNEQGEVLKEETPLGWTLVKEQPGSGLQAGSSEPVPEVMAGSAIPATGLVEEPANLRRVRLRLHKFPPLGEDVDGGRQRLLESDPVEIIVEVEEIPWTKPRSLAEEAKSALLGSDAFVQSDDPKIRDLARRLANGLPPLKAAQQIALWVHENVRKTPTLSIPSAREVLEQRAGDCNEHTVLFTALARAAGIPTRICTGLAWTNRRFYYHAWAEVWVDGWIAVDPTFGQFPADALHLRLLVGGMERQYEVLGFLGRGATIEIVEGE